MYFRGLICSVFLLAAASVARAEDPTATHTPEFGGQCAMSASLGVHRPTSCSVVWISPQDKLYCFSSEQAKQVFMKDPDVNERRAQAFWKDPDLYERLKKQQPEG